MALFCYITRSFSYKCHSVSFILQLILRNATFVSIGVGRIFFQGRPPMDFSKVFSRWVPKVVKFGFPTRT